MVKTNLLTPIYQIWVVVWIVEFHKHTYIQRLLNDNILGMPTSDKNDLTTQNSTYHIKFYEEQTWLFVVYQSQSKKCLTTLRL